MKPIYVPKGKAKEYRVYQHTFADNKKQFAQALADKTAALLKEKQPD